MPNLKQAEKEKKRAIEYENVTVLLIRIAINVFMLPLKIWTDWYIEEHVKYISSVMDAFNNVTNRP